MYNRIILCDGARVAGAPSAQRPTRGKLSGWRNQRSGDLPECQVKQTNPHAAYLGALPLTGTQLLQPIAAAAV